VNEALLLDTLTVAVPLAIGRLAGAGEAQRADLARHLRLAGPAAAPGTPGRRLDLSRLAERPDGGYPLGAADDMLYGGQRCAAHPRERWPDTAVCPACLREETGP